MNLGQWIGLFAILLSLYILWQIKEVLLLLFAAVVLASTLNRLARRFQRSGMSRGFSVLLSVGIFIALIVGFFWLIVPSFAVQFQELTRQFPQGLERFNTWLDELKTRIPAQLIPYIPDIDSLSKEAQPFFNRVLGSSFAFVSGSLEVVLKILLVMVLTGMFLANPQAYRKVFIRLFPSFYRRRVDGILDRCEQSLGGWVIGAIIAMAVVGSMSVLGLWILQVPSALALGVLAGFLNLIPNLGPTMSVIPAMAIALLDAPWKPLAVLILYFIIQQAESNFITPIVMAHQVSLLPAVTLTAQLFFAYFFGFLGLFLALPLTVVAKIWVQEVLIKDVLDQWGTNTETELVMLSDVDEPDDLPETSTNDVQHPLDH
ncbi:AI-2E family transporter [Calothrix sp. 336/3]|uniref:AI-2E family transporter n=1 Tax=Calothrix sp. 336/3 TaxID=1337936 RepID=UPI0004E29B3A|nr:AI-2E family transporter [Calothrix sp. 336/3]AKG23085.1 membrane protein [Calothrix sp. 336/3]